MNMVDGQR